MRIRRTPVTARSGRFVCLLAVAAMSIASAPLPGAGTQAEGPAFETAQSIEAARWKKLIKRLKLADPESTEMMLA